MNPINHYIMYLFRNNRIQPEYTLRQARLISNENPEIVIGICGKKHEADIENPLSYQCIRIDNEMELYSMKKMVETSDSLCFEYEKNIQLCFLKYKKDILVHINSSKYNKTSIMQKILLDNFKGPKLASNEYDKIEKFVKG